MRFSNRVCWGSTARFAVALGPAARLRPSDGAICAFVYSTSGLFCGELLTELAVAPPRFCNVPLSWKLHGSGYTPFSLSCVWLPHGVLTWQKAWLRAWLVNAVPMLYPRF